MKILALNPDACTGCRSCEVACSFAHGKDFSLMDARVNTINEESRGFTIPTFCIRCQEKYCQNACPFNAIRIGVLGEILVDEKICTGCKKCLAACPYDGMKYSLSRKKANACDLCGGNPQCTRICPTGALQYVEKNLPIHLKMQTVAMQIKQIISKRRKKP